MTAGHRQLVTSTGPADPAKSREYAGEHKMESSKRERAQCAVPRRPFVLGSRQNTAGKEEKYG